MIYQFLIIGTDIVVIGIGKYLTSTFSRQWCTNTSNEIIGTGFKMLEIYLPIPFLFDGLEKNGLEAKLHTGFGEILVCVINCVCTH